MRLPLTFWLIPALLLNSRPLPAQDDVDFEKAAGNNIGRTESEDGDPGRIVNDQLGDLGGTVFEVAFDQPGEATFALYSQKDQLVRILGQVIPVEARPYRIRWDGLDLFGNLVPAGTSLELKTFFNPGIRVTYEMAVRPPKVAPWPGTYPGKDGKPRFGGWLGDHSTPHGATAVGDTVFLGYTLAEAGYNMVGVNPQGEVVWTDKLQGWDGPSLLNSNGEAIAAMSRRANAVFRMEPDMKWDERRERWEVEKQKLIGGSGFQHLTVHQNDLLIIGGNQAVTQPLPHPRAFGNRQIDFIKSIPQVLNNTPPSDFHISPQAAFGSTFTQGGSPQVGTRMVPHDGYAFVLVALKEPARVGTVVIPALGDDVARVEVLTLKSGVEYQESMAPNAGSGGDDLMSLTLNTQSTDWVPLGSSGLDQPLNWISSPDGPVQTHAVLIKAYPKSAKANWKPGLPMARILGSSVKPATNANPRMATSTHMTDWKPGFQSPTGWRGTTEFPISDTYPMWVTLTYSTPISFNTLLVMDALNPVLEVQALSKGISPDSASENDWEDIGTIGRNYNKKLGHRTSSRHYFERYLQVRDPVTTTAIRLRIPQGYQRGKWGKSKDNPSFTEAEFVQALTLDRREHIQEEAPAAHKLYWVDFSSGDLKQTWTRSEYDVGTFDFAPDGTLYAVAKGRLNTVDWNRQSGEFRFTPLGRATFDDDHTLFMDVDDDRIAISDANGHVVRIFDHSGTPTLTLGTGDHRRPGVWNPAEIDNPRSVALTSYGDIWVTENAFAPKRISRFARDGAFREDFLGPPMYGGGGHMDPDGRRMFYRGMEFTFDLDTGTSELAGLYDRPYAENTPDASAFTFGGIRYANPVYVNGHRYLVGGGIIARKEDEPGSAIPAVVYGWASENKFLEHEVWKAHWARQDLNGTFFVWCDRNEDGAYQINEVELANGSTLPKGVGGGTVGPGLSLWGKHFRWAPSRFTPKGVPIFEIPGIEAFDYDALAPHYPRNYTLSGPTSAKPGYGGIRYVSTDGYLAQEGQPFVVKPDGTLLGGPPPEPSDYIPEIPGRLVQTAWSWAGGAVTDSPVGEIAIINSYKGAWHIWGVKHGVMLGRFFTGEEGTFNDMNPGRGADVTRRYMGWEGWHADFVKTEKGRYLAQGGKTFHSMNEVHGLDDYQVFEQSFTVSPEDARLAQTLRPTLRARFRADQGHHMQAYARKSRLDRSFKLDGLIEDWGDRGQFIFMDEEERTTRFDLSYDGQGLLIAIDGRGSLEGGIQDWRKAVSDGFAIDIQIRRGGKRIQGSTGLLEGDARIFVSKVKGEWRGILYRPRAENGPIAPLRIPSPYLDLEAQEFRMLGENEIGIEIREKSLDVDVLNIGGESGGFDMGGLGDDLMLETEKSGGETKMGAGQNWTAELLLPWALIGKGEGERRFDIGIRENGPRGRWFYWNNAFPGPRDQMELHLHPNPRAWGTIGLYPRKD